jgi:hypothetical protein
MPNPQPPYRRPPVESLAAFYKAISVSLRTDLSCQPRLVPTTACERPPWLGVSSESVTMRGIAGLALSL